MRAFVSYVFFSLVFSGALCPEARALPLKTGLAGPTTQAKTGTIQSDKIDHVLPGERITIYQNSGSLATFGSYNNRMAEESGKLFVGLKLTLNGVSERIVIMQSDDRGDSWSMLYDQGFTGEQPPVLASDHAGTLYAVYKDHTNGCGRFLKFKPNLSGNYVQKISKCIGEVGTKFSMVYNRIYDRIHISRRLNNGTLNVLTLNHKGNKVYSVDIATRKDLGSGEYYDAHYHSLAVDYFGTVYLIYNPHRFFADGGFVREKVLLLKSISIGAGWARADNSPVSVPFEANDYQNGGTPISSQETAYDVNLAVTHSDIHILYWSYGVPDAGTWHVILDKYSGIEKHRQKVPVGYHSSIIINQPFGLGEMYLFGYTADDSGKPVPSLYRSSDNGFKWHLSHQVNADSTYGWNFGSGLPYVSDSGDVYHAATHTLLPNEVHDVDLFRFNLNSN